MTQVFSQTGEIVPVTRVMAGPCQIVQIKTPEKQNVQAVEIGFDEVKDFRVNKPKSGHLKDLKPMRYLRSFETEKIDGLNRGDIITVEVFSPGDKVTVSGNSKGRGFAGVVKRHHFKGSPATHGHKHDLRAPGAIGAGGVQRVFKGTRMAGRMGGEPVTVQNLEIVEVRPEINELLIKGAVPGARNTLIKIYCPGDLEIKKIEEPATEDMTSVEKVDQENEESKNDEQVVGETTTEVKNDTVETPSLEKTVEGDKQEMKVEEPTVTSQ